MKHVKILALCALCLCSSAEVSLSGGIGTKDKPAGVIIHNLRPYDPPEFYEFYTVDRSNSITDYVLLKDGHEIRVNVDRFAVLIPYPETRASWPPDKIAATKKAIDDASKLYPQWKQKLAAVKARWLQYEASIAKAAAANVPSKPLDQPSLQGTGERIATMNGTVYEHSTITHVEPDGITVTHDAGIAKIPFTDLSPEIRQKYNYDPKKAAQFIAGTQAADAQRQAQLEADVAQQQGADNASAAVQQQQEKDRKDAKWIVGKVARVQNSSVLLTPPDQGDRVADELGATELAKRRFSEERASLDSSFQEYLGKGGTFFGSVTGMRYIAAHWIKAPDDYRQYFSLAALHQAKALLKSLAVFPPVDTDEEILVRLPGSLGVVDGDYVSLWIVPDGTAKDESGRTYRAYRLFGK